MASRAGEPARRDAIAFGGVERRRPNSSPVEPKSLSKRAMNSGSRHLAEAVTVRRIALLKEIQSGLDLTPAGL